MCPQLGHFSVTYEPMQVALVHVTASDVNAVDLPLAKHPRLRESSFGSCPSASVQTGMHPDVNV